MNKLLNIYVFVAPLLALILIVLGAILNNVFLASLGSIPTITGIMACVYVDTH